MSYLLLPLDEAELVRHLCDELGLALLLSDVTDGGIPRVASRPLEAIPDHLPWQPRAIIPGQPLPGPSEPLSLIFWCRALGPVRTLADAPPPTEAADRVAALLTREAAGRTYADTIDMTRTPVVVWRRTRFQNERRLIPGRMGGMPVRMKGHPPEIGKLCRRIERWLKKRGERLNPFEHCSNTPVPQPRSMGIFWVWVHPAAMEWVRDGGEIWPWAG